MAHSAISGTVPLHSPATAGPAHPAGGGAAANTAPCGSRDGFRCIWWRRCAWRSCFWSSSRRFGAQTYRGVQDTLRTVAYDETRFIREALSEKVQRILEPAEGQLALLAYSDLSAANTLPQRLAELPLILEALKRTTLVDASFVGYPNGEFMLFRPLRSGDAAHGVRSARQGCADGAVGHPRPGGRDARPASVLRCRRQAAGFGGQAGLSLRSADQALVQGGG